MAYYISVSSILATVMCTLALIAGLCVGLSQFQMQSHRSVPLQAELAISPQKEPEHIIVDFARLLQEHQRPPLHHRDLWQATRCGVWCPLAMAAILVLIIAHEIHQSLCCASSRPSGVHLRRLQCLNIVSEFLWGVDGSSLIPLSFRLSDHYGGGTTFSGFLIGVWFVAVSIGALPALLLHNRNPVSARLCLVGAVCMLSLCGFAQAVTLQMGLPSTIWALSVLAGFRSMSGFLTGFQMILMLFTCRATPAVQQTTLCIAQIVARNLGLAVGPLMSSFMISLIRVNHWVDSPSSQAAAILLPVAMTWMLFAWSVSWLLVGDVKHLFTEADDENERHLIKSASAVACGITEKSYLEPQELSIPNRKHFIVLSTMYQVERSFSCGAVEVSTALILERSFAWSPQTIGYVMGFAFVSTAVVATVAQVATYWGWLHEFTLAKIMSMAALIGTFFLFSPPNALGYNGPIGLIVGDCMLYSSAYVASGIMEGLANQAAIPESNWSIETYKVINALLQDCGRGLLATISRGVVGAHGRNAYAAMMCAFAVVGSLLTHHTLRI
eukprot:CAMPEP_0194524342 /NCGR_PEP_ID=MMETSP0253-20130528/59467_1 /TAXON_ID=2966 /ORGANISM="Noctiluca scintillans" /LENGTH=554 /DNA_ID=CAMNT_0039368961 /DNA_START=49 /DNA_END=1710 /DNA_ORIENTATION=-